MIPNITASELTPVLDIYKQHRSDLWRHMPSNVIDVVERFHMVEAVPVLKMLAKENTFPAYIRQRAIAVIDSLTADEQFLREIVTLYGNSADANDLEVLATARDALIIGHSDPVSIRQKLQMVRLATAHRSS